MGDLNRPYFFMFANNVFGEYNNFKNDIRLFMIRGVIIKLEELVWKN